MAESFNLSIRDSFFSYFEIVPAVTQELRHISFNIRYQVYCEELGYEDKSRFPEGYESDDYDSHSHICLLRHRSTDRYAGTVRLVLSEDELGRPKPLPFEHHCHVNPAILNLRELPARSYGEISRLAVTAQFRRRQGEDKVPHGLAEEEESRQSEERNQRSQFPHIAMGLYLSAAAIGLNLGMERAFAMMEPRLARRLQIFGIRFAQVGDEVEHRGKRAPFQIDKPGLYESMHPEIALLLQDIRHIVSVFEPM